MERWREESFIAQIATQFPRRARPRCPTFSAVTSRLTSVIFFLLANTAVSQADSFPPKSGAPYMGTASCSSSSCHGGAGEQRNQFLIWSQQDFHARSSLILTTARSAQMAQSLGTATAQEDPRCFVCHSPLRGVSQMRVIQPAQQGVSCESCHGPAEPWLRSHTRKDYTYAMRVGSGLRDLRNIYVRANACVACHQVLEQDVEAAGHPPLFFELATQIKSEPPHWREPSHGGMRLWLTGQAVALRELSWAATRDGESGPRAQGVALSWLLAKVTAADDALPRIIEQTELAALQRAADELARRAFARDFTDEDTRRVVTALCAAGNVLREGRRSGSDEVFFYRAKRIELAFEALLPVNDPSFSAEFGQLTKDVASMSGFSAAAFVQHLDTFRLKFDSQSR